MKTEKVGYQQIVAIVEDWIRSGQYGPGDRFPTEKELAKQFGVAKLTVTRALNVLREGGTLVSERGRGTFVSLTRSPKARRVEVRGVMRREIEGLESVTKSVPITTYSEPGDNLRVLFHLAEDEKIIESEYFLLLKKKIFAYVVSQFPPKSGKFIIHADEDLVAPRAIPRMLEKYGLIAARVQTSIAAIMANQTLAEKLGIKIGNPVLRATKTIYDDKNLIFQRQTVYYRSDLYEYDIEHLRTEATTDI